MRRRRSPPTSIFSSPEADGPLTASLDWRRSEGEEWTIDDRDRGRREVRLEDGGARLILDGAGAGDDGPGEYPDIYRQFVDLIDERRSLVDVAPLRLVADCLLRRREDVEPSTVDGASSHVTALSTDTGRSRAACSAQ